MNFTIANLERNREDGVVVAHWRVSKESDGVTASGYGTIGFEPDASSEGFVPFADLTEATVVEWVKEKLNLEEVEGALDTYIQEQISPSILVGVPWETAAAEESQEEEQEVE